MMAPTLTVTTQLTPQMTLTATTLVAKMGGEDDTGDDTDGDDSGGEDDKTTPAGDDSGGEDDTGEDTDRRVGR